MGRKDEVVNFNAMQNESEPVDRLNLLNRWINSKLDEFVQAEERITKRMEHLNATENSLKNLFEALRRQVVETQPVLKELAQLRASALNAVEQVVRTSTSGKGKPEAIPQPPPLPSATAMNDSIDLAIELRLNEQFAAFEEKIRALTQAAQAAMSAEAVRIDGEIDANVTTVHQHMEHRLLTLQQSSDAIANRAADQMDAIQARTNDMSRIVDMQIAEGITTLHNEFDSMAGPIEKRLETQVSEMETRITTEMSNVEETMKAQLNGFYLHIDQTTATFQGQLEHLASDFRKQADAMLASSRQHIRQQIDTMEEEAQLAVRPILQRIEDRRAITERQCEGALSGLDEALKIRLGELRRSGESMIHLVESQLIDKLKLIRPQAQVAIDSAQKHVGQSMQAVLENARAHVELSEKQLADRIEDLRPRATAALQAAKIEINQQIASIETEANTATGWIEQRLTQRIDELTYRARKSVTEQIRELDDASEKLRRREDPDHRSDEPVEVDIHVENPQARTNAA